MASEAIFHVIQDSYRYNRSLEIFLYNIVVFQVFQEKYTNMEHCSPWTQYLYLYPCIPGVPGQEKYTTMEHSTPGPSISIYPCIPGVPGEVYYYGTLFPWTQYLYLYPCIPGVPGQEKYTTMEHYPWTQYIYISLYSRCSRRSILLWNTVPLDLPPRCQFCSYYFTQHIYPCLS